ncbi:MAG: hypothetical protein ACKV0T_16585 [Planctomycetales bacterium]
MPPKKDDGKVCGGCGRVIAQLSRSLGMTDSDAIGPSRNFLEQAMAITPVARRLVQSMHRADQFIVAAIRNNPAVLGDVTLAMARAAEFAELILAAPGSATDRLKLPRITERSFRRSIKGLRKASQNKKFHKELDFLEVELKRWSGQTVAQVRARFLKR